MSKQSSNIISFNKYEINFNKYYIIILYIRETILRNNIIIKRFKIKGKIMLKLKIVALYI